jgi:predicted phosphoribosyltransferase
MSFHGIFRDRRHAGQELADRLPEFRNSGALVVALPRGGVPVAEVIASGLDLELDVLVVRKIGAPGNPEFAVGAIGPGGVFVMNDRAATRYPDEEDFMEQTVARERAELRRREELYRAGQPPLAVEGRAILLVDDGLATGATMRAAIRVLRHLGAGRCVVAVPVASRDAVALVGKEADEVVCVLTPWGFRGVGQFYEDFSQTTDEEVLGLLAKPRERNKQSPP